MDHYRKKQNKAGFTLVELIIVLAIIAILAALLIPSLIGYLSEAQATTCGANRAAAQRLLAAESALHGLSQESEAIKALADGNMAPDTLCPAGGKVSLQKENDEWRLSCSIHSGKTPPQIVGENVQTLLGKAVTDYYSRPNASADLNSTGPNFGMQLRSTLATELGIPEDGFDFRIYRTTDKNECYVYVFNPLSTYSAGDRMEATRYVFRSDGSGGFTMDETATTSGTGVVGTQTVNDTAGKPYTFQYLNTGDQVWQQTQ